MSSSGLLQKNYFELFGVTPSFRLEPRLLEDSWKRLQAVVHPDKLASQGLGSSRRLAVEMSTRVNEAYQTLSSPLQRALYLMELSGFKLDPELSSKVPLAFLEQQMEWREQIDEAKSQGSDAYVQAARALHVQLEQQVSQVHEELASLFKVFPVPESAADLVKQTIQSLMFLERFEQSLPH
ncbi:MAG: Fe-S protein assembly co-chaperone HscB [Burkholderiaceae bacterium]